MFIAILAACSLFAHPFHVTIAEATWNETGDRLQVALRVSPRDLDNALSNIGGKPIVLEKESADAKRKLIEAYLKKVIFLRGSDKPEKLTDPQQQTARENRFHWVGIQEEIRYTWIYFELQKPDNVTALVLSNRIFFETEPTQINTFQLMKTDPPIALRTTRETPTQPMPLAAKPQADR